jgi:hypothetical protein
VNSQRREVKQELVKLHEDTEKAAAQTGKVGPVEFIQVDVFVLSARVAGLSAF